MALALPALTAAAVNAVSGALANRRREGLIGDAQLMTNRVPGSALSGGRGARRLPHRDSQLRKVYTLRWNQEARRLDRTAGPPLLTGGRLA